MKSKTFCWLALFLPHVLFIPGYFVTKDLFGQHGSSEFMALFKWMVALWEFTGFFWIILLSLIFGYAFVGMGLMLYSTLSVYGVIKDNSYIQT